jgi:hypothetical protein
MGSYKDDSDRFHALLKQHERDLLWADGCNQLLAVIEARGVDADRMFETLETEDRRLARFGFDRAWRRALTVAMILLAAGFSIDDLRRQFPHQFALLAIC